MEYTARLICLLIGYAIGCVQTSYLVGKLTANIDIRQHGSGNAGTTNTFRVLGKAAGVFVFVCDVLKGVIGFFVCGLIFGDIAMVGLYGGIGVILGHNFPVFLKFKGGKGIASTLGVFLCLEWRLALVVYAIGVLILLATRYVSLTSLAIVFLYSVGMIILKNPPESVVLCVFAALMAFVLHRGNIQRLLSGTERKISVKIF